MASLTTRDVHLNQFLTNLSVAYRPMGMIADQIYPVVPVNKQTDNYAVINKGDWLRRPDTNRAPGQKPNQVRFTVTSDTYNAANYALGTEVEYETQDNADAPHTPLVNANQFLIDQLMLDFEVRVEASVATGVGSSQTLTGTDVWDDFANSDPITNIRTARQAVRATTGFRPNVAIIGQKAWDVIQYHPDLVRAANPGAGVGGTVSQQQFAAICNVDRVLVGETIRNTANEGATDAFSDVWSTACYLLYVAPSPGLMRPSFGYAFRWGGPKIGRGGPGNFQVFTREDEEAGATRIWTGYYQDEKIVASELGFRIDTGIN